MIPTTGVPAIDWFLALLDEWGYLVVLGFTIFENLFVIGSVTPGETVVIAASAVASNEGLMLRFVWIASTVGTVVGSNISYWLGRRAGMGGVEELVTNLAQTRIGRIVRIDPSGLDEVEEHFHTQGARTVFISRFAIGAKNFVPAVAGATRMPVFWFELYTLLGAVVYTSLMCIIGWFLGNNLPAALRVASGVGYVGLAIMIGFLGLIWYGRQRYKIRKARKEADQ